MNSARRSSSVDGAGRRRVAVIGGGITGLAAGWHLRQAGAAVTIFEATHRIGGVVGATREDGWMHEGGPNSLLEDSPEVAQLIDALGLGPRRVYASPAARNRYVIRGSRLVAVPASPPAFLCSPLFSWPAKLRALTEPLRGRRGGAGEESVADFVRRRLGAEFLDYAVDPFVAGVYTGDARELSMRHAFPKLYAWERDHGSLLRGMLRRRAQAGRIRPRTLSFPEGLDELTAALAKGLEGALRLRTRVWGLSRTGGRWRVDFETGGGAAAEEIFSAVICALPGDRLAELNFGGVPEAARLGVLREIVQPPVVSVFTGFRREDVGHPLDGFGFLAPRVEHRRILGTLFTSSLFPGRAPAGHVALTSFVGGARAPELALLDDNTLLEIVLGELQELLGIRGAPVIARWHRWPRAIPQYNIGHQRFLDACAAAEAAAPGLCIGGNARDGISLSACLESGRRLARAALGA